MQRVNYSWLCPVPSSGSDSKIELQNRGWQQRGHSRQWPTTPVIRVAIDISDYPDTPKTDDLHARLTEKTGTNRTIQLTRRLEPDCLFSHSLHSLTMAIQQKAPDL